MHIRVATLVVMVGAACGGTAPAPRAPPAQPDPPTDPDLVDGFVEGPAHEVRSSGIQLTVPAIPAFDLPSPHADGSHSIKALHVRGKKLLDRDVTIKGVITWVYDCVTAIRTPGMTEKKAKELIDQDPTVCDRPKFYVGDAATTPAERSMWVVDVPRPYNKLELTRLKKQDRTAADRCEPTDKKSVCPPHKVGDQVEIVGTWALASPHSERNSDGLVVYKWMKNVTQRWESPGTRPTTEAAPAPQPQPPPVAEPTLPTARSPIAKVRRSVLDESMAATNEGSKAYGQRQWDTAIERFTKAVEHWRDNHQAWYGMSVAFAQLKEWAKAVDAAGTAVQIAPGTAMYHLISGRFVYEKAIQQAREDQARKEGKRVDEIEVDLGVVNFEKAKAHLATSLQLDGGLWRAYYLLGSIYRFESKPKQAASAFSKAMELGAHEAAPYIALAELYRAWDYTDHAIKVAEQGVLVVGTGNEKSDVWFELGMAYDDKLANDKAIEAFDKALDARRDHQLARFARGQAYFRKRDFAKAKRDLEEFSKAAAASLDFYKVQASRMLMDIAAKK